MIPEIVFMAFQATFAGITCALIVGAFAERMKFSAVLIFMVIWFTFSYIPIAHMVWFWPGPDATPTPNWLTASTPPPARSGNGAPRLRGRYRWCINAGVAGLVGALPSWQARRLRQGSLPAALADPDHGWCTLLWVGWFGFNAGSALEANGTAGLAFMNTFVATAAAVMSWILAEWFLKGKPSMLGAASGAVAGLVAITPAAGNVGLMGALIIGILVGPALPVGVIRSQENARLTTRSTCSACMHWAASSARWPPASSTARTWRPELCCRLGEDGNDQAG